MNVLALRALFYAGCGACSVAVLGVCAVGFLSMGDPFVEYTVVNDTDRELLTWLHMRDCSNVFGYKGEHSDTEEIPPGGVLNYSQAGFREGCVQIATSDRRVIVAEDYQADLVVRVEEPIHFLSGPVPLEGELPSAPHSSVLDQLVGHANWQVRTIEVLLSVVLGGGILAVASGRAIRAGGASP